jgi:hypothetical protein
MSFTQHVGSGLFQYTLANSNVRLKLQGSSGAHMVECDPSVQVELLDAGVQVVMADVVAVDDPCHHEPKALASALLDLYEEASREKSSEAIAVGASR